MPTFLVMERGLSLSAMANFSLFMYGGMFAGFQIFGVMADKVGRRPAMMAAFVLVSGSVASTSSSATPFSCLVGRGCRHRGERGGGGRRRLLRRAFPRHLRAYAGGFCWNAGRIGAVVAPYTIGYIGKAHGLAHGLAVTCVINLLGVVVLCFLPETLEQGRKEEAT